MITAVFNPHFNLTMCLNQAHFQSLMYFNCVTPDPGYQWESDKLTDKHHKQKPRGQLFTSR